MDDMRWVGREPDGKQDLRLLSVYDLERTWQLLSKTVGERHVYRVLRGFTLHRSIVVVQLQRCPDWAPPTGSQSSTMS